MNKYDKALYFEIFQNQEYKEILKYLKNIDTFYDIGAYKGFFSLYLLKNGFKGKIILIEPVKDFFNEAKDLLKGYNNIYFKNCLIKSSLSKNNLYFTIDLKKGGNSGLYLNKIYDKKLKKFFKPNQFKTIKIDKICYLNEVIQKNNIGIKLDIEGEEIFLINETKWQDKVKFLIFEYHLFNKQFEYLFNKGLNNLKKFFSSINISPSKYTNKIGLVICYKR